MVPCRQLAVANRHGQVLGEKKENDALKRVSFWYADTLLNFDIDHSDFSKNGKITPIWVTAVITPFIAGAWRDHPSWDTWLITMVSKSPKDWVVPLPNGLLMAYKWW